MVRLSNRQCKTIKSTKTGILLLNPNFNQVKLLYLPTIILILNYLFKKYLVGILSEFHKLIPCWRPCDKDQCHSFTLFLTPICLFTKKKYLGQVLIKTAESRGNLLISIKRRWSQTSRSRKYQLCNKFCIQRKCIYLQVNCLLNKCRHAKYRFHI